MGRTIGGGAPQQLALAPFVFTNASAFLSQMLLSGVLEHMEVPDCVG